MNCNRLVSLALVLAGCGASDAPPRTPPATPSPAAVSDEGGGQCLPPRAPLATIQAGTDGRFPSQACIDTARSVLSKMSLRQKLGQMVQQERRNLGNGLDVEELSLGSVLSGGGSAPPENTPFEWAKMVNGFRQRSLDSSARLPILYGVDAVHGHNNVKGAVLFPHNIGLGASRDPDLVRRIGEATARAVAATNVDWAFAPVLAVAGDERWGRTYEAFGERPELAELLGPALIRGLQGDRLGQNPHSVLACAKHFVADGNTLGGKDRGDAPLSMEEIQSQLLPAYQKAIEAGVGSVMVSFSSVNGVKMHCHGPLLNDVLKAELGFNGLVVSDWEAVELLPGDYPTQLENSINAGLDMVMHPKSHREFLNTMERLVPERVRLERIDDAVTRILTVKCELGMAKPNAFPLDRSGQLAISGPLESVGSKAHRELGREAVRKSLVLLKNENEVLPLKSSLKRIVVGGRNANDIGNQSGGWSIEWQGQSGPITTGTTIFQGLAQQGVARGIEVVFSEDGSLAPGADLAVVALGERPYAEANGDDADLELDPVEVKLALSMADAGVPLVVVLVAGRPMILEPLLKRAHAVVVAWLPGTEGQGVADVLFGDHDFVGKLPHSWPRSIEQLPLNWDPNEVPDPLAMSTSWPRVSDLAASKGGAYDPLFPYGYGLSYANQSEIPPTEAPAASAPSGPVPVGTSSVPPAATGRAQ